MTAITRRTRADDLPEYLSTDEVASWLGLHRGVIYRLTRPSTDDDGAEQPPRLASVRFGRMLRIPREALLEYATRRQT